MARLRQAMHLLGLVGLFLGTQLHVKSTLMEIGTRSVIVAIVVPVRVGTCSHVAEVETAIMTANE